MADRAAGDLPQLGIRLRFAALVIGSLFSIGTVGYKIIGGPEHSWMEAVYMTANVLTTTGFREAVGVEGKPVAMLFTVAMMFIGAGTVVYAISIFTAFIIEGDLSQGFRRRRMRRAIAQMNGHYVVCGAGATGYAVLAELVKTERAVVVIDSASSRVSRLENDFADIPVVQGDFTDDQILLQAGVNRAEGIVICTTIDKDSLVATITARQLNPTIRIIARAANERAMARLRQAGADSVVSPALIGGVRMASELVRPNVVNFLDTMLRDTDRDLRIEEILIAADAPVIGASLGELQAHERANCLLLAIKDPNGGGYTYNPPNAHRITPGIVLVVMGDPTGVRMLRDACGTSSALTPAPGIAGVM